MNWDCNGFVGNSSVQNASIRTCFQALLQNCHFAGDSTSTVDKSSKIYKIWAMIVHYNSAFTDVFSDEADKNIDEHITKFKGCPSTR